MRIDLLGLQAFVSIAERGSFLHAATALNLSQTALSHRIRKLEADLETELLIRTTRSVTLTRAGADLLPRARRCIDDLESSIDEVRSLNRRRQETLSVGCLPTAAARYLPGIVSQFAAQRPDVHLTIYDNIAADLSQLVATGRIELALTLVSFLDSELHSEPLLKEPFFLVCRNDHPFAQETEVNCDDLATLPLIRIGAQTGHRRLLDDALGPRREKLNWRFEVQHTWAAISLVEGGVGATIVPRMAVNLERMPTLVGIPTRNPRLSRSLGIISRREVPLSPSASLFRSIIIETLKSKGDRYAEVASVP